MDSFISNMIWCGCVMVLNLIIFLGAKKIHKKDLDQRLLTTPSDEWGVDNIAYTKFWDMAKVVNILVWVVIIAGFLLFHSNVGKNNDPADMGATQTQQEAAETVPVTKEEIKSTNKYSLKEKEVIRKAQIADEQQKSRDEFSDFLNNSN